MNDKHKLYSSLKVFHFHSKLNDMERGTISAPVHVRLKPTNRCNHSCAYCCYRNKELFLNELFDEKDEIPWPKMSEIVADLGDAGIKAVILSGGGEPLCYPRAADLVRDLAGSGVKVAILTNGSLLRGKVAEVAAGHATWVRVSMDAADAGAYARTRGVAEKEFGKVCENIRAFAKIRGRKAVLGVNLIVTAENAHSLREFLLLAREMGVDNVKVSPAIVATDAAREAAYLRPFFDEVKAAIAGARADIEDDKFAIIDRFHMPDDKNGEEFAKSYTRCPMTEFLVVIGADLNVYACHDKAYTSRGILGSLRGQSFARLLASGEYAKRLRGINPSVDCRHHCTANAKNLALLDYLETDAGHVDFV